MRLRHPSGSPFVAEEKGYRLGLSLGGAGRQFRKRDGERKRGFYYSCLIKLDRFGFQLKCIQRPPAVEGAIDRERKSRVRERGRE